MKAGLRVGLWIPLGAFVALGVAGLVWPYVPGADVDMQSSFIAPSLSHVFGTDWLGRDLLQRLAYGTRGFFIPGLLAASLALVVGTVLGAFTGYSPDPIWASGARILGVIQAPVRLALSLPGALPRFVTIVLVFASFGFGAYLLGAAAGLLYAAELGEDLRTRVAACYREEFIESARADGLSESWILGYHVLYLQCRLLVARHLAYLWAFVVLVETSLSFMPGEFGIQEPHASWGNILIGAKESVATHPWPAVLATIAIVGIVLLLTRIGDALVEPSVPSAQPADSEELSDG